MAGRTPRLLFRNIQNRLQHELSHESSELTENDEYAQVSAGKVPFIASPLDARAETWLRKQKEAAENSGTTKRRVKIAQYDASKISGGIFKKRRESSTLELFFDLFFVANLAVFTTNYEKNSALAVGNYIGFFVILWSSWFQVSLFDVRFYVDSTLNRLCNLLVFSIFTTITALGPAYRSLSDQTSTRGFKAVALVLMALRFMLVLQYASVLYYVRMFKKTALPLALLILLYLCTGFGFLATYLDDGGATTTNARQGVHNTIVWYCLIGFEIVASMTVSSVWRVLSFRRTHLVERVGLLTLIIMGEGIIGLLRTASYILQGESFGVWSNAGGVFAAVIIIYVVYILYFSPIDHDRFGTIRQQIWALLHLPLHIALLLTEEGSNESLLWTVCIGGRQWLQQQLPSLTKPSAGFDSTSAFIENVTSVMKTTSGRYSYIALEHTFNYTESLARVSDLSEPFGTMSWNEQVSEILSDIFNETTIFIFENFQFETPKEAEDESDPNIKLAYYYEAYQTTFTYFYIAAGCLLLLMAAMLWIGKKHKSPTEFVSIIARVVVGVAIPPVAATAYLQPTETGFIFTAIGWLGPIVMFCFLAVNLVDNHLNSFAFLFTLLPGRFSNAGSKEGFDVEEGVEDGKGHAGKNTQPRPGHTNKQLKHYAHHRGERDALAAAQSFGRPSSVAESEPEEDDRPDNEEEDSNSDDAAEHDTMVNEPARGSQRYSGRRPPPPSQP